MTDDEIVIQIRADAERADAQIKQLRQDLFGLGDSGTKAAGGLTNLEKAAAGTRSTIGSLDKDVKLFGKNIGSMSDALHGMGVNIPVTPMAAFGQATAAAGRFLKQSVDDTVDYNKAIADLGRNIGASLEDTSRLVQVADDYRITQDQLKTAMQLAVKNGFEPSIENLAKLADQYNSIQDPVQRAAILTEKFGRNWAVLTPILEQGGDALRAQAAAVKDGLIVTEESIKASEDYRLAVDDLNDSWDAFAMTIGNKAIPGLTSLVDLFGQLVDGSANADSAANVINKTFAGTFLESRSAKLTRTAIESGQGIADDGFMGKPLPGTTAPVSTPMNAAATGTMKLYQDDMLAKQAAVKQERLNDSMAEYAQLLAGPVSQEAKRYEKEQEAITDRMQEINDQIDKVNEKPWLPGAADQVKELRGEQTKLSGTLSESTAEHEKAQKTMVLGMMQQQMAADGLSQAETDALMDIAQGWGLVDEETAKAWDIAKQYVESLDSSIAKADALGIAVDELPEYKKIIIDLQVRGDDWIVGELGGNKGGGGRATGTGKGTGPAAYGASGLDMTVPAGYEGDRFPVFANSGERVQITPPGKPGFNAGGGGNITIYGRTTIVNGTPSPTNRRAALREARVN